LLPSIPYVQTLQRRRNNCSSCLCPVGKKVNYCSSRNLPTPHNLNKLFVFKVWKPISFSRWTLLHGVSTIILRVNVENSNFFGGGGGGGWRCVVGRVASHVSEAHSAFIFRVKIGPSKRPTQRHISQLADLKLWQHLCENLKFNLPFFGYEKVYMSWISQDHLYHKY
jgi:hypothetical protein